MKNSSIILLCSTLSLACSQQKYDATALCNDFYALNKSKQFEILYDTKIGFGRVQNIYNEQSKRYRLFFQDISVYDPVLNEYVIIPIFSKTATTLEKKLAFDHCSQKAKQILVRKFSDRGSESLFEKYTRYITNVLDCYDQIATPKALSNENIRVDGNPTLGRFITFTLDEKTKCYYVKDETSLTPYWLKFFSASHKLDKHWYYSTQVTAKAF